MSTKVLVEESSLEAIASAIRAKNSSQTTYKPSEMAEAIWDISGYPEPTGSVSITQNGTANVKDYASANVNVPNSYAAGDEGKVVSNGALVAQTSKSITENGTHDTTLNNSVVVNVSGGGSSDLVTPDYQGLAYSYLAISGDYYQSNEGKIYYSTYYSVKAGDTYVIFVGETVSDRLRIHFYSGKNYSDFETYVNNGGTNTPIYGCTNNVTGASDLSGDRLKERFIFTPSVDGELIVITSRSSVNAKAYCVKIQ